MDQPLLRLASENVIVTFHDKNRRCLLSQLCDVHGSDKGALQKTGHPYSWPAHSYTDYYARLFNHCRLSMKKVFECGLGTNNPDLPSNMTSSGKPGASLRVWRDYFPNALIVGADIDRQILFEEDRIRTYYVDQTDPKAIADFWSKVGQDDFDFIVDDGLHTFAAGKCLFENSIHKLSQHGIYIIEDVTVEDLALYQGFFKGRDYSVDYVNLYRPDVPLADNNLVVIRHP